MFSVLKLCVLFFVLDHSEAVRLAFAILPCIDHILLSLGEDVNIVGAYVGSCLTIAMSGECCAFRLVIAILLNSVFKHTD